MTGCPCDRCRSTPPRMDCEWCDDGWIGSAECSNCDGPRKTEAMDYLARTIGLPLVCGCIKTESNEWQCCDYHRGFNDGYDAATTGYPSATDDDKIAGAVITGRPDRSGRAPGTGRDESPDSDEPVTAPAPYPSVTDPCPTCEGKGYFGERDDEDVCWDCNGTGRYPSVTDDTGTP